MKLSPLGGNPIGAHSLPPSNPFFTGGRWLNTNRELIADALDIDTEPIKTLTDFRAAVIRKYKEAWISATGNVTAAQPSLEEKIASFRDFTNRFIRPVLGRLGFDVNGPEDLAKAVYGLDDRFPLNTGFRQMVIKALGVSEERFRNELKQAISEKDPTRWLITPEEMRKAESATPDRFLETPPHTPFIEKTTVISHETAMKYNAPHHFRVTHKNTGELIGEVHFQEGPVKEVGHNGIQNEDALAMVIERLEGLAKTPYAGPETARALAHIKLGLAWLEARTANRQKRGVEGRNKI